jgi:hypothetical protein
MKAIAIAYAVLACVVCTGTRSFAAGKPLPPKVAAQLKKFSPAAYAPVPKSAYGKITPFKSNEKRYPERKHMIETGGEPFVLMSISDDAKAVEMRVPDGSGGYTNRWFDTEDAFGPIEWDLKKYEMECRHLAYHMGKKNVPELLASIPAGTVCASLGTLRVGIRKTPHHLVLMRRNAKAAGMDAEFLIAVVRPAPPVRTKQEYDTRAAELLAEHAYRNGREWGKMHPALLTNEGCFECAGMASDFAHYMFGGGLHSGRKFTDASEIRDGDIVYMKTHFFSVVHRHGDKLHTIEGNMNAKISQSTNRYSVRGGQLYCGGQKREFVYGRHCFEPQKNAGE